MHGCGSFVFNSPATMHGCGYFLDLETLEEGGGEEEEKEDEENDDHDQEKMMELKKMRERVACLIYTI